MLMRYDPFRELDRLLQAPEARTGTMPMDAYRDGDRYIVHFDLPGVDPDKIEVTVEKNALTVRGERTWQLSEGQDVLIAERPQGTFTRQIMLSENIDPDRISAGYERGVLTITVPVAEQTKPRRIQIAMDDGAFHPIDAKAEERVPAKSSGRGR